jgi:hypothetical protein
MSVFSVLHTSDFHYQHLLKDDPDNKEDDGAFASKPKGTN